jgi:hypothetical protein
MLKNITHTALVLQTLVNMVTDHWVPYRAGNLSSEADLSFSRPILLNVINQLRMHIMQWHENMQQIK